MFASFPLLLLERLSMVAASLWLVMLLGWFIGRFFHLDLVINALGTLAAMIGRRLNRRRDAATRAWRGVIVLMLFLLPALVLGFLLQRQLDMFGEGVFLIAGFLAALRSYRMVDLWRRARNHALSLEAWRTPHLFADIHGVLRYEILTHATHFSIGVVGSGFWYVVAGLPGMFGYLVLALLSSVYATEHAENVAFGGVARALFAALDTPPRLIGHLLFVIAGFFIPGCRSLAALRHFAAPLEQRARFLATLLDISLGGPIPVAGRTHNLSWVGEGTARLDATQLSRWLLVWLVAQILLGLATLAPGFTLGS